MYEQLELPIDAADPAPGEAPAPVPIYEARPLPIEPAPFARWLLGQQDRGGLVGALAKAARGDTGFPRKGTANDVRARLASAGAEGDMFEAVDDAERLWLCDAGAAGDDRY